MFLQKNITPNSVIKGQRVDELFGIISDVTEMRTNNALLLRFT
jgi:hypothetical protein